MSKYPHNYLLNNWVSYKNIQVGTLSQISSEIEQPLALTTNISTTNNDESVSGKCISRGPSNIQIILTHSVKLSILHLVIGRAFHCVLSLFLDRDKTCFLLLISLFICCRYWKCKLWVDQKNVPGWINIWPFVVHCYWHNIIHRHLTLTSSHPQWGGQSPRSSNSYKNIWNNYLGQICFDRFDVN